MYTLKKLTDAELMPQKAGQGVSMRMLLSPSEAPNFAMRNFVIEAGGYMPVHTNTVEHEQYVLSGKAAVQIGDKEIEAKAGDVLMIPAGVPHGYKTIGDEAYSFLCLVPNIEDKIEILSC
ncbi:MAG: cupin domain-containing protein [Campylobacterales bacterium]|nr:cupin domain-containing protein [Campylobacterales bacterium]